MIKECNGFKYSIQNVEKAADLSDANYMNKFFSVTSDKVNNKYTVSINIPYSENSKPEV